MYYYGNNGYWGGNNTGCMPVTGYTTGSGVGSAIWIVLFILLVIIIGAGYMWNNN
ncbi:MAG: sporulation protein YjcZ [Bacilli bacterium]|nr:sporulation protein YjcZ [Bacilli bacterium]